MSARTNAHLVVLAVLAAALAGCASPPPPTVRTARPAPPVVEGWVVTAASPVVAPDDGWEAHEVWADGLDGSTLRQVVHSSIGGGAARAAISNRAGTVPLVVGGAGVAVMAQAAGSSVALREGTQRPLTFAGEPSVTVAPGEEVVSDEVELAVPADHDLAVDLAIGGPTGVPNGARASGQTSWRGDGDLVGVATGEGFTESRTGLAYVAAVEVRAEQPEGAVVVLGDSKSDGGILVPPDSEQRWSDVLLDRLVAAGRRGVGVANVSFMGATLLPADDPTSGVGRFDADVLARAGVRTVIVALGTNDLLWRTTDEIAAALAELVERGHVAGLRLIGATIPPFAGSRADAPCIDTDPPDMRREGTRLGVNERIRGDDGVEPLAFDAVVDFDAVLGDPVDRSRIACRFSLLGNSHPSTTGHAPWARPST